MTLYVLVPGQIRQILFAAHPKTDLHIGPQSTEKMIEGQRTLQAGAFINPEVPAEDIVGILDDSLFNILFADLIVESLYLRSKGLH